MSLTKIISAKKAGFSKKILRLKKDHPKQTLLYMKQKSSFLVATLSLVAFIAGNMVGQHGWYAFWKATLGQYDDSLITYTGTVPPIAFVPDYSKWAQYGGNASQDTYREVPQDDLVPLPAYNETFEKTKPASNNSDVYSVAYMGDYKSGDEGAGSHPAVDIRVPQGTPIRSIANGIVESVKNDPYGFGLYIVIRHPNVPDPNNPDYTTVLHSVYAHLSAQLVSEGDVVQKGQEIGLSGMTGDATGPHLHFQVDRDSAPWHPYWPFSGADLRQANLSTLQAINSAFHQDVAYANTVNPMLFVQADLPPAKYDQSAPTTIASNQKSSVSTVAAKQLTIADMVAQRKAQRLALLGQQAAATKTVAVTPVPAVVQKSTTVADIQSPQALGPAPIIVAPAPSDVSAPVTTSPASTIAIEAGRQYVSRQWQTIRLILESANGSNTTSTQGLPSKIYMRTAYGDAEFNPPVLSASDFVNGVATVKMLPRGTKTIVIQLQPMGVTSMPMQYTKGQ